jgi:hypothetical protein
LSVEECYFDPSSERNVGFEPEQKKNTVASISVNVFFRLEIAWLQKLAK